MQQLRARRPNLATDSAPCMRESHILADPSPLVMGAVDCAGHVQQRLFASVLSRSAGICPLLHAEVCHSSLHTALVFAYDCNSAPPPVSPCAAACPCLQGPILDSRFGLQSDPWICAGSVLMRAMAGVLA